MASFRRAAYALHALPSEPLLNLALYAGLASLRLPACRTPADASATGEATSNMDITREVPSPRRVSPSPTASSDTGEHNEDVAMDESELLDMSLLERQGNPDCPTCDPCLSVLAQEVPFSHHVNSTIVCSASGRIMDADNGPFCFPTGGGVYCREVDLFNAQLSNSTLILRLVS